MWPSAERDQPVQDRSASIEMFMKPVSDISFKYIYHCSFTTKIYSHYRSIVNNKIVNALVKKVALKPTTITSF